MSNPFALDLQTKTKQCPNVPSSEDTNMSSSSDHTHQKKFKKIINKDTLNDYHQYKETKLLINKYGNDFFTLLKKEDIPFMRETIAKHSLCSENRCKMVDWMYEIFASYYSEPKTFFLCVHIMDTFLSRTFYSVSNEEIHLLGLCCIYIASKMEDLFPIHLSHIVSKIGYNKFTKEQIQQKEKEILATIDFDIVNNSCFDFINAFLLDFSFNNNEIVKNYMKEEFHIFEETCFYLCRLSCLSWEFSFFTNYIKAICILILSYDIMSTKYPEVDKKGVLFLREWISFVIKESKMDKTMLNFIYQQLSLLYRINMTGEIGNYLLLHKKY